jgi:hypothetical protein
MQSEVPSSSVPEPARGLPPVVPLSGGTLARQFLVPLMIVAVAVGVIVLGYILIIGSRSPEQLIKNLDDANPDVRWRAASDLALELQKNDRLAANPSFGLDLAERLHRTADTVETSEKAIAERLHKYPQLVEPFRKRVQEDQNFAGPPDDPEWRALLTEWNALEPSLNYLLFLASCLGNMSVPVGAPELCELAAKRGADDNILIQRQHRHAVWSLASLGGNLARLDKLLPAEREAIMANLEEEAGKRGLRATWASQTLEYLHGKKDALGVDNVLAGCARSNDPFLRAQVALALAYWEGGHSEETLDELSSDDGRGAPPERQELDGQEIRYQAWLALARRGSDRLRRGLGPLADMLDEEKLKKQFSALPPDQEVPGAVMVQGIVMGTLKALIELHRRQPDIDLSPLYPALEKLTQNSNSTLSNQARETLLSLRGQ